MKIHPSGDSPLSRRAFLERSLVVAGAALVGARFARAEEGGAPAVMRSRPSSEFGVMAGDVLHDRAIIWSRTDRPSRMFVDLAATEEFKSPRRVRGPAVLPDTDYTAALDVGGLEPGAEVFYRVSFQDLDDRRAWSEPLIGRLRTPSLIDRGVRLVWSGDVCGQGWGINPEFGGLPIFERMRLRRPDLFLHSGDAVYADNPIRAEENLPDGRVWRNVVTEAKSKVAESLDEFRGNYLYNLLDANVRRFYAEVPQVPQWDDHEVVNNWYPGEILEDAAYRVKSVDLLAARGQRAFLEYTPLRRDATDRERIYRRLPLGRGADLFVLDMRSYRGPNAENRAERADPTTAFLGDAQVDWLIGELAASRATWKLIAADQPVALMIGDGANAWEGMANGDGLPLGRELELARILAGIQAAGVENVVWLTADVHFAAAHRYAPEHAQWRGSFVPFHEFVAGPIHAGSFRSPPLDPTFGPEVLFRREPPTQGPAPWDGYVNFGELEIEPESHTLKVSWRGLEDAPIHELVLEPKRRGG